jgi:hypothetical protein
MGNTTREEMITALLWAIMERLVAITGKPLGPLNIGLIWCPETMIINYHVHCVITQKSAVLVSFAA